VPSWLLLNSSRNNCVASLLLSSLCYCSVDPKGNSRLKDTLQLLSTRTDPTMSDVLTSYQIIIAEAVVKKVRGTGHDASL
jgi:hypothetical protein